MPGTAEFRRRPEETRDTTIGTPEFRRRRRKIEGNYSHRGPSLVLDALIDSNWRQTWTA